MNQVEIKAVINIEDPVQLAAAQIFLQALAEEAEAPKAPRKKKAKATTAKAAEAPEETPAPQEQEDKGIDVEQVREVMGNKLKSTPDNKAKIKAKLTEFGANNVSTLDAEKYEDFLTFLNTLS